LIRLPRLSQQVVLGDVADRAARESLGFLTLPNHGFAVSRWRAILRIFCCCRVKHLVDTAFQVAAFGAEKSGGPPPL
jgi:hypothetical protein